MGSRCIGTEREDITFERGIAEGGEEYVQPHRAAEEEEGERREPISAKKEADAAALCEDEGIREGTQGPRAKGGGAQEKVSAAHGY